MAVPFEIPEWLVDQSAPPPPPPVDDHRVEGLVNGFIAGKQDALFDAPDAYYRTEGADALDGAPAIAQRLQDLRSATLTLARDDGERAALAPRLDAHIDDAMDGIGRHVAAQRLVFQRNTLGTRQALIQRAAALEHDNDGKIAGLAEAHASAAQELARLSGIAPGSNDEADVLNAARSQILRTAIEQRIANARGAQAIDLHDRMTYALTPADRQALELPIAAARDDTATDAWLARQAGIDGPPLADRAERDGTLPDMQRLILRAKIDARDSAAESSRAATMKGLDDQLAAATQAIATQPSQYRTGTLNALAKAYEDAGAPEQATDTRRLASQESILRLFAQTGVAAQQRALAEMSGPERTMAEAIMNHQDEAFANDPYAAGAALYPDVGPALPEEDADGRLRQERMIEAMRGSQSPASSQAVGEPSPGQDDPFIHVNATPNDTAPVPSSDGEPDAAPDEQIAQAPNQAKPKPSSRRTPPKRPPPQEEIVYPTKQQAAEIETNIERTKQEIARRQGVWDDILRTPPKIEPGDRAQPTLMPDDWEREANRENPQYAQWIKEAAEREHIPVILLARLLYKESVFTATAGSERGAKGIAQLMPSALLEMNKDMGLKLDPNTFKYFDPKTSIDTGAAYLAHLRRKLGDWPSAVAAYNGGWVKIYQWRNAVTADKEAPNDETKTMLQRIFRTDPKAFGD